MKPLFLHLLRVILQASGIPALVLMVVVFIAGGLAVAVMWAGTVLVVGSPRHDLWLGVVVFVLVVASGLFGLYGAIAAHELGHLAAGLLMRIRPTHVQVGPLTVWKDDIGWHATWNWRRMAGGMVYGLTADTRDLGRRCAVFIAGGPLASLLLAAVAGSAVWLLLREAFRAESVGCAIAANLLAPLALISQYYFLASLAPLRSKGVASDGVQLIHLLTDPARGERDLALMILSAAALSPGQRPRDWNPAFLEIVTAIRDESQQEALGWELAYYHALDTGATDRAGEFMRRFRDMAANLPDPPRSDMLLEAAYFSAYHLGDLTEARRLHERASGQVAPPEVMARADAAYCLQEGRQALAEGRPDQARRAAVDGLDALHRCPAAPYAPIDSLVHDLQALADTATRAEAANPGRG